MKKMMSLKQPTFSLFLLVLTLHSAATAVAQAPASAPPPSTGPDNITAILEKAGQFTTLIRLLKSTQVGDQMNNQLNNSNQGLTLFAPTDNAFSNLKAGTLNSLTDQQKVSLVQFHVLPSMLSLSQFQTVSNPVRTQAGNGNGQFPLNVTTSGTQVNISTGLVNTTVANAIYTDSQLAVYQVDNVLLPVDIFRSSSPSPAPAPTPASKKAKKSSSSDSQGPSGSSDASLGSSGVFRAGMGVVLGTLGVVFTAVFVV